MNETRSRTALVTGASTGIGRATALALARAGFDLAIADLDANWLADVREQHCADKGSNQVSILLNQGNFSFTPGSLHNSAAA